MKIPPPNDTAGDDPSATATAHDKTAGTASPTVSAALPPATLTRPPLSPGTRAFGLLLAIRGRTVPEIVAAILASGADHLRAAHKPSTREPKP